PTPRSRLSTHRQRLQQAVRQPRRGIGHPSGSLTQRLAQNHLALRWYRDGLVLDSPWLGTLIPRIHLATSISNGSSAFNARFNRLLTVPTGTPNTRAASRPVKPCRYTSSVTDG